MSSFWAQTLPQEVHIVALGDSAICGRGEGPTETHPAQLEAAPTAKGHKVTIVKQGVDGETTAGILANLDRMIPATTDIVVLNIGDPQRK